MFDNLDSNRGCVVICQRQKKAASILGHRLPVFIGLLWLGMIVGISFVATPLKFQAPGVTLEMGLDIGRLVFGVFNKIEIAFALLMAVLILLGKKKDISLVALGLVWLALALQTFWLLPALVERIQWVHQGQQLPPSLLHSIYVGLEVLKILALAVFGFQKIEPPTFPGTKV
jgi:hypothetical protein